MTSKDMPRVYNSNNELLAILEKASNVGYRQAFNDIWTAQFTLIADDPKNKYCTMFNYIEIYDENRRIELFRIVNSTLSRNGRGFITYECEHVITTLLDNVLFKFHQIGNIGVFTPRVLDYILGFQTVRRWRLGRCDFNHQFLYKWESENLLAALFSVPRPFSDVWKYTYDTSVFPWVLNLVRADAEASCEIRYAKNMQSITKYVDATNIVTRLYPLGYGEGDNQLTIESVNNGIPFLDASNLGQFGVKETIWTDRRFEDAQNLMSTARTILDKLSVPHIAYSVTSIDLFKRTMQDFDKFIEGRIVRVIDTQDNINIDTRIIEIIKPDVTKMDISVVIENKERDVAGSISRLQERARIHETYAQGSETLIMIPYIDNADPQHPAFFEFFIPQDMININQAFLRIQLQPFRAFSRAVRGGGGITATTASGGGSTQTSSNGGGSTQTSSSGGGSTQTSSSGGGTTATSSSGGGTTATSSAGGSSTPTTSSGGSTNPTTSISGGNRNISVAGFMTGTASHVGNGTSWQTHPDNHRHQIHGWNTPISIDHSHNVSIQDHTHTVTIQTHTHNVSIPNHSHSITISNHTHNITIPNHTHSVTIPNHTHNVTIPSHTHSLTIPDHIHEIEFGIFQGQTASQVSIRVDGNLVPIQMNQLNNINIVPFLSRDGGERIQRGAFHRLEVVPDRMTRISAQIFMSIFTNSRSGANA